VGYRRFLPAWAKSRQPERACLCERAAKTARGPEGAKPGLFKTPAVAVVGLTSPAHPWPRCRNCAIADEAAGAVGEGPKTVLAKKLLLEGNENVVANPVPFPC